MPDPRLYKSDGSTWTPIVQGGAPIDFISSERYADTTALESAFPAASNNGQYALVDDYTGNVADASAFESATSGTAGILAALSSASDGDYVVGDSAGRPVIARASNDDNGVLGAWRFVTVPDESIVIDETDPDAVTGVTSTLNGGTIDYNSTVAGKCAIQTSGSACLMFWDQASSRTRAEVLLTNLHIDSSGTQYFFNVRLYDGSNWIGVQVRDSVNSGNLSTSTGADTGITMGLTQTRSLRVVLDTSGEIAVWVDDEQLPSYHATGLSASVSANAATIRIDCQPISGDQTTASFDVLHMATETT